MVVASARIVPASQKNVSASGRGSRSRQASILDGGRHVFRLMSALGQKQTLHSEIAMSALPPKADIQAAFGYYCWWARVLKFVEHHP
jgi:hypothetical protein